MLAAADSAQTPPIGCSRVSLVPIVRTMRQPPNSVPRAMAAWHDSTTHRGTAASALTLLAAMSRARITPIVFCASFEPWPRLNAAADMSCNPRNVRFTDCGCRIRCTIQLTPTISTMASASPINGE